MVCRRISTLFLTRILLFVSMSARPAGPRASGDSLVSISNLTIGWLGLQAYTGVPGLSWILGIQTQLITVVQQTFYPLSHFPSPRILFDILLYKGVNKIQRWCDLSEATPTKYEEKHSNPCLIGHSEGTSITTAPLPIVSHLWSVWRLRHEGTSSLADFRWQCMCQEINCSPLLTKNINVDITDTFYWASRLWTVKYINNVGR